MDKIIIFAEAKFIFFMSHHQLDFYEERRDPQKSLEEIRSNPSPISLVLDQLQNPGNIGAIFRLADAARIEKIYLYKSLFSSSDRKFKRAARATFKHLPFESLFEPEDLKNLKTDHQLIALEKTNRSIPYHDLTLNADKKTLLIVGQENLGISDEILELSEQVIHLPMLGLNTSINVAGATAVALYKILELKKLI